MLLALALTLGSSVSPGRITYLERTEYTSARSTFRLVVDPTDRLGAGAAWYRLQADDSVLWQGRLPFTLQRALVAESGVVVGYAFTHGSLSSRGSLIAVRIDEAGTACVVGSIERKPPCCPDSSPDPVAATLAWRDDEKRFAAYPIDSTRRPDSFSSRWVFDIDAGPQPDSIWNGWSWRAREAEPPSRPGDVLHVDVGPMPTTEPEPLPPVLLGGAQRWPFERAHGAALLADGGYAVIDDEGIVWLFEPTGALRSRSAKIDAIEPDEWDTAFLATSNGCAFEGDDIWIELDPLGRLLDMCDYGRRSYYLRRRPVLQGLLEGAELVLGSGEAELRERSGPIAARFERAADQRWIAWCKDAAATRDGWVGVLDRRTAGGENSDWLHVHDREGHALRSLELEHSGYSRSPRLRVAGDLFLVDRPGAGALLVDPKTGAARILRPVAVGGSGSRIVAVVPSAAGDTIAVFESDSALVRRFVRPSID